MTVLVVKDGPSQITVRELSQPIHIASAVLPVTAGGSTARYEHQQLIAATVWTVNHQLGYRPVIEVLGPGGIEIDADVIHVDVNLAQVVLQSPLTGIVIAV
jgi:hypothetical protein